MLEKNKEFKIEGVIEEFEALTKDAGRVQRETLRRILEENGKAEYLQNLGLGGRADPETFKACVPLVTHKDLEPYIQRIVDGDASPILTGKPVTSISLRYFLDTSFGLLRIKSKFGMPIVAFLVYLLFSLTIVLALHKESPNFCCSMRNWSIPQCRYIGYHLL